MFAGFDFDWPPAVKAVYNLYSLVNFNLELLAPECSLSINIEAKWLVPILLSAVVCLASAAYPSGGPQVEPLWCPTPVQVNRSVIAADACVRDLHRRDRHPIATTGANPRPARPALWVPWAVQHT